jgi:hypothetical protein
VFGSFQPAIISRLDVWPVCRFDRSQNNTMLTDLVAFSWKFNLAHLPCRTVLIINFIINNNSSSSRSSRSSSHHRLSVCINCALCNQHQPLLQQHRQYWFFDSRLIMAIAEQMQSLWSHGFIRIIVIVIIIIITIFAIPQHLRHFSGVRCLHHLSCTPSAITRFANN